MMTLSTSEDVWPSDEMPPVGSWKSKKKVIPYHEYDKFPWQEKEQETDSGKWTQTPAPNPNTNFNEWYEWYKNRPQINMSSDQKCAFDSAVEQAKARGEKGPFILHMSCSCPKCRIMC